MFGPIPFTNNLLAFFVLQSSNDLSKTAKKLQAQVKDLNGRIEEETRQKEEQHQLAAKAEKRANDLTIEVEELRSNAEQVRESYYASFYVIFMKIK